MGDTRAIAIPGELKARIDAQGRRDYPRETCGFLIGTAGAGGVSVRQVREAANANTGNPRRFYEIDRAAYEAAEREAASRGLELIGIYHTHPDAAAAPSETDAAYAFPEWVYWITPVNGGVPGDARVWLRTWAPEGWREMDLVVEEV